MDDPSTSDQAKAFLEEQAARDWQTDEDETDDDVVDFEAEKENIPPVKKASQKSPASVSRRPKTSMNVNKMVYDGEVVENFYPKKTFLNVMRRDVIVEFDANEQKNVVKLNPEQDDLCVICRETKDQEGCDEMIICQGGVKGKECKSKFHLSCITKYNADSFQFQYAALPECQNKLLCPRHCCAQCNVSHYKQSAYMGELTECAICLRAFHSTGCLPAGSVDISHHLGKKFFNKKFIICPTHVDFGRDPEKVQNSSLLKRHLKSCMYCDEKKDLIECSVCCRCFHSACMEVEEVDGAAVDPQKCAHCLCADTIKLGQPVLAKWGAAFWIAVSRPWSYLPEGHKLRNDINFEVSGYTLVHWVLEPKPSYGICPMNEVVLMEKFYLGLAKNSHVRNLWKGVISQYQTPKPPSLCRKVIEEGDSSKYLTPKRITDVHEVGLCECEGTNRCTDDGCKYKAAGAECPPECAKDGRICNNRNVSEKTVHPNIFLKQTEQKGFGVFAKSAIGENDFISEYVGEVIDRQERDRRKKLLDQSLDHQANHYMMALSLNRTVDAARFGNISRYVNHSCDPNCGAFCTRIYVKSNKKKSQYETRAYIKTIKEIKEGEELTFNYGHTANLNTGVKCYCGAANCNGKLWGKRNAADESAHLNDSDITLSESTENIAVVEPSPVKTPKRTGQQRKRSKTPRRSQSVPRARRSYVAVTPATPVLAIPVTAASVTPETSEEAEKPAPHLKKIKFQSPMDGDTPTREPFNHALTTKGIIKVVKTEDGNDVRRPTEQEDEYVNKRLIVSKAATALCSEQLMDTNDDIDIDTLMMSFEDSFVDEYYDDTKPGPSTRRSNRAINEEMKQLRLAQFQRLSKEHSTDHTDHNHEKVAIDDSLHSMSSHIEDPEIRFTPIDRFVRISEIDVPSMYSDRVPTHQDETEMEEDVAPAAPGVAKKKRRRSRRMIAPNVDRVTRRAASETKTEEPVEKSMKLVPEPTSSESTVDPNVYVPLYPPPKISWPYPFAPSFYTKRTVAKFTVRGPDGEPLVDKRGDNQKEDDEPLATRRVRRGPKIPRSSSPHC